jgi:hypothetical protein
MRAGVMGGRIQGRGADSAPLILRLLEDEEGHGGAWHDDEGPHEHDGWHDDDGWQDQEGDWDDQHVLELHRELSGVPHAQGQARVRVITVGPDGEHHEEEFDVPLGGGVQFHDAEGHSGGHPFEIHVEAEAGKDAPHGARRVRIRRGDGGGHELEQEFELDLTEEALHAFDLSEVLDELPDIPGHSKSVGIRVGTSEPQVFVLHGGDSDGEGAGTPGYQLFHDSEGKTERDDFRRAHPSIVLEDVTFGVAGEAAPGEVQRWVELRTDHARRSEADALRERIRELEMVIQALKAELDEVGDPR